MAVHPRWHVPVLALAVLAVHLWVMSGAPLLMAPWPGRSTGAGFSFGTRRIEPAVAAQAHAQAVADAGAMAAAATPSGATLPPRREPRSSQVSSSPVPLSDSEATPPRPDRDEAVQAASAPMPQVWRLPAPQQLSFQVEGEIRRVPFLAEASLVWQHDGRRYMARLELQGHPRGRRFQTSEGWLTEAGLLPERYGERTRSEVAVHFERSQGRIRFSTNTPEAPLLPGTQDRLSALLQLAGWLAGSPERFAEGQRLAMPTAGPRELDTWQLDVAGEESVPGPGGPVLAWHLVRLPQRPYEAQTEWWLAKSHQGMPVKMRQTLANGDFIQWMLMAADIP